MRKIMKWGLSTLLLMSSSAARGDETIIGDRAGLITRTDFPDKDDYDRTTCIDIYRPVCGIDDVTYANSCYARAAVAYEGECEKERNGMEDLHRCDGLEMDTRSWCIQPLPYIYKTGGK